MQKSKKLWTQFIIVVISLFMFSVQIEAVAHKPIISGNYEQGQRIYTEQDGRGDDYLFKDGWLKIKQNLSSESYYYFRIEYSENDFLTQNIYDRRALDFLLDYTQQIIKPLRVKTDLGFQDIYYQESDVKSYRQLSANVELTYKPTKPDELTCGMKLEQESYIDGLKDNLVAGINLRWERKFSNKLSVHTAYTLTSENYFDPKSLPDKMRQAFSLGFEYQL